MPNGFTPLHIINITKTMPAFYVIVIAIAICFVIVTIAYKKNYVVTHFISVAIVFILCDILLVGLFYNGWKYKVGERYQCLIDEDVPVDEIYKNYKVVDRFGDIWTLEDK